MKINLDTVVTQLNGKPFTENGKDMTAGVILSSCLDLGKEGGRMKMFILAKKCYEGGTADFDEADLSLMKKSVESSQITSNVVIGQLISLLEKAEK